MLALIGMTHLNVRRLRFSSSSVHSVCSMSVILRDEWNPSRNLDRPYSDWNSASMLTGRMVLISWRPSWIDVHSDMLTKGSSWWWWWWWCGCWCRPSSWPESLESLDSLLVAGTAGSMLLFETVFQSGLVHAAKVYHKICSRHVSLKRRDDNRKMHVEVSIVWPRFVCQLWQLSHTASRFVYVFRFLALNKHAFISAFGNSVDKHW